MGLAEAGGRGGAPPHGVALREGLAGVDLARAELRDELVRTARGVSDKGLLAAVLRFLDEGAVDSGGEEEEEGEREVVAGVGGGAYSGFGPGSLTGTPARGAATWEVSPPTAALEPASPPRAPADPRGAKKAFGLVGSTPASVLDDSAQLFASPAAGAAAGGPRFRPRAPEGSELLDSPGARAGGAAGTAYGLAALGRAGGHLSAGLEEEAFYAPRPEPPLAPAALDSLLPGRWAEARQGEAAPALGAEVDGAAAQEADEDAADEEDWLSGAAAAGPRGGGLARGVTAALAAALRAGAMVGGVVALAAVAAKDREAFVHLASARATHLGSRFARGALGKAPGALGGAAKALGAGAKALGTGAVALGSGAKAVAGASSRAAGSLFSQLPDLPAGVTPTVLKGSRDAGPMLEVRTMRAPGGGLGPALAGEAPTNAVYETPPPPAAEWASPVPQVPLSMPVPARAPLVPRSAASAVSAGGGARPNALSGMG